MIIFFLFLNSMNVFSITRVRLCTIVHSILRSGRTKVIKGIFDEEQLVPVNNGRIKWDKPAFKG